MNFITGDKFKTIANYQFAPAVKNGEDYDKLQNTLDIDQLKNGDIIYTHTFYAKQLFEIIKNINKKLIIITHNSDQNIDESYKLPDNVIKWYAQNVNVINPRIESIPIGLENDKWFPELRKKEKITLQIQKERKYRNIVYLNHKISNNSSERDKPYQLLEGKSWVTTIKGEPFDQYIDNIYNHLFVICPAGNGLDTHRLWECLYLGTIPIVKTDINNSFYKNLPIFYVDDWRQIFEELLNVVAISYGDVEHNMNMLDFNYWKNKILKR